MPARAAAAGRPRAPVPVRLAARGRSDARPAAPRPPSERRVRREHDFCLQAGFPPGHDGGGPPASSRPNVSGAPGERGAARALSPRPGRAAASESPSRSPEKGEARAAAPPPGAPRVAAADQPPPVGFRAGAGPGEAGECPDVRSGAGTGSGASGTRAGTRDPRAGTGRAPARGARRPEVGWGAVRACTLLSSETPG